MAVYQGARQRATIVLPRAPGIGARRTAPPKAGATTLPRRRTRSAVRARRGASRISLLLGAIVIVFAAAFFSLSQDIRVSATGYELDRLATQERQLDAHFPAGVPSLRIMMFRTCRQRRILPTE